MRGRPRATSFPPPAERPPATRTMSASLFDLIRLSSPDRIFCETADGKPLTYGGVLAWTGRLANILVLSAVEPGDRVVVQVDKAAENLLLYLAVLRAGAVYVPLDTAYSLRELEYFIGALAPKLVVCDPARRDALAAIAERHGVSAVETLDAQGGGMLMEAAAKAPADFADVPREDDDPAAILFTSGKGGLPRRATLSHRDLASQARLPVDDERLSPGDVLARLLQL
ncbi:MAG: AMP-binding protein [Sphingomicrobium sp.]